MQSESFVNDAAKIFFSTNALLAASASAMTLEVIYDADTSTYRIVTTGESSPETYAFAPGDLDAAASNDRFAIYSKPTSATEESVLLLTKPGDEGAFNLTYVGGGWLGLKRDGRSDYFGGVVYPFAYGVATDPADVPITGTAKFGLSIYGVQYPGKTISGDGILTADFGAGTFRASGIYDFTDNGSTFDGTGTISSAALNAVIGGSRWDGRFYGPDAVELGFVFYSGGTFGRSGFILGRRNGAIPLSGYDRRIATTASTSSELEYTHPEGAPNNPTRVTPKNGGIDLTVNPATRSQRVTFFDNPAPSQTADLNSDDRVAAESTAQYDTYRVTDGDTQFTTRLYNGENLTVPLTYTGFANARVAITDAGTGQVRVVERWSIYGVPTYEAGFPITGTASYNGQLFGSGVATGDEGYFTVSGTSGFSVDFGANTISGTLNPILTNNANGSVYTLGTMTSDTVTINRSLNSFFLTFANTPTSQNGTALGSFYGLSAEELAAVFRFVVPAGAVEAREIDVRGVATGKRD